MRPTRVLKDGTALDYSADPLFYLFSRHRGFTRSSLACAASATLKQKRRSRLPPLILPSRP